MKKLSLSVALIVSCFTLPAAADDAPAARPNHRGAVVLPPVVVTGKRLPVASASIMRIQPSMTLTELRVSLLEKVEKAMFGEHF